MRTAWLMLVLSSLVLSSAFAGEGTGTARSCYEFTADGKMTGFSVGYILVFDDTNFGTDKPLEFVAASDLNLGFNPSAVGLTNLYKVSGKYIDLGNVSRKRYVVSNAGDDRHETLHAFDANPKNKLLVKIALSSKGDDVTAQVKLDVPIQGGQKRLIRPIAGKPSTFQCKAIGLDYIDPEEVRTDRLDVGGLAFGASILIAQVSRSRIQISHPGEANEQVHAYDPNPQSELVIIIATYSDGIATRARVKLDVPMLDKKKRLVRQSEAKNFRCFPQGIETLDLTLFLKSGQIH